MDPFVPKHGPLSITVEALCGYSPTGRDGDYCSALATWHVMWDGDADNSFACDPHMELIKTRWMFDDRHPVSPDCGMPGALWLYSEQRCGFPDEPIAAQTARLAAAAERRQSP